ncbi:hypothetical protein NPX99_04165 [Bartonella sp. 220]|nr:hypothetical protein [Bartonella sp. 220B]MCZ2158474.1 hypothetical protein [Bartonella sp. 220B]
MALHFYEHCSHQQWEKHHTGWVNGFGKHVKMDVEDVFTITSCNATE